MAIFLPGTADDQALALDEMTPREIVAELDKYVVGQGAAKRAVAIALRDRMLRHLEALLIVCDTTATFVLSGTGDVIEPDDGIVAIGSGGSFALASARALMENTERSAREIAEKSLRIAGQICIYTNDQLTIEELKKA